MQSERSDAGSETDEEFRDGLDDWFADPVHNVPTIESIRERELVYNQRSPEWFEARKDMLTGSRIAACLGIDNLTSQNDLLLKSIDIALPEKEDEFKKMATEWGMKYEPEALQAYSEQTGFKLIEFSLIKHENVSWLGGSPDSITESLDRIIEVKCPPMRKIVYGEVPTKYLPQLYINMRCAKIHKADFVEYYPGKPLNIVTVHFSQAWWDENWPKIVNYWNRYLFYRATVHDLSLRITEISARCRQYDKDYGFKHIRPKDKLLFLIRKYRRDRGQLLEGEEFEQDTWPKPRKRKAAEVGEEAEQAQAQAEGEIVMYTDL